MITTAESGGGIGFDDETRHSDPPCTIVSRGLSVSDVSHDWYPPDPIGCEGRFAFAWKPGSRRESEDKVDG
ncbi:hypothetical protein [Methylobacterium goesingense]|uniref:hypothetical protein n=1 Tax=Methylobacterium goesingense TaxID=243690 RepID=UPI001EE15AC7|nr:hypothetical protein [Methylobacterium goesingense]GJD75791.1 hypothetical protein CFIICLFH_4036 [Methylobacterium goesingense]